jgi:hypothetical protein
VQLRTFAAVVLTSGLVLTAGCGDGNQYLNQTPSGNLMSQQQQYAELMKRPTINEVVARYEEMRAKIQSKLSSDLGITNWEDKHDGRQSGCANEFPEVSSNDIVRNFMSFIIAPTNVPSEHWPAAAAIVSEISSEYGFDQKGLQLDRSPHFEFGLKDQYQAQVSLSTEKTTVLSVETGCHLTVEAKRRGGPRQ